MSETRDDLLLDHDYDGIREYDNPLPGWWVWLFILSVLFAWPYTLWFHANEGRTIHDEYQAEVAHHAERLLAQFGELRPDAPTILRLMDDPVAHAGTSGMFRAKCAQCHKPDGSGMVGPNLTDDHWLNVKTLADVPRLIAEGNPTKGMPAWQDQLSETQITLLSAYVAALRRHPIEGKEPQGEAIPPWPAPPDAPGGTGAP